MISFDESLNEKTHIRKIDVYIPYWGSYNKQGKVRYCGSEFLGNATSKVLATSFNKSIESLNQPRILQMLWTDRMSERENDPPSLVDIGTCNLHAVNSVFKIGAESTKWKLKKF